MKSIGSNWVVPLVVFLLYAVVPAHPLFGFSFFGLKSDEEVIFFPVTAHQGKNPGEWSAEIHGWIFEREEDSAWRRIFLNSTALASTKNSQEKWRLKKRMELFLVDNERWKSLAIRLFGKRFAMNRSSSNGHFKTGISFSMKGKKMTQTTTFRLETPAGDRRNFPGKIFLVPPQGFSVISDIDDTVKISNVVNKTELLKNTFRRPFKAVPQMASFFQKLKTRGCFFHYVSASPWALFPAIHEFLKREKFPPGEVILKTVRLKDSTLFSLIMNPAGYKIQKISPILKRYPMRRFILVGDSGEKDPEAYGFLARTFKNRIHHIFIREIPERPMDSIRIKKAFQNLPKSMWTVFKNGGTLKQHPLPGGE